MNTLKTKSLFLLLYLFLSITLQAAILNDDFEVNDGGWQNHQGTTHIANPINSTVLVLAYHNYSYKIYDFGIAAANANITIDFDFYAAGKWKNTDYFGVYFNGAWQYYNNIPSANGNTNIVKRHFTFHGILDNSGKLILYTYVNSNQSTKKGYLDNVSLSTTGTPPTISNIPNISVQENTSLLINLANYVTNTDGDPILSYALTCAPVITGMNFSSTSGLFTGYPYPVGNYNCTANATDKDGVSNNSTFTVSVTASPQSPPIMLPIPDINITINTPVNINLSTYVVPTNGDTITYTLTGTLPTGLNFDRNTGIISGQAIQEINATLALKATDNDGDSNTSTFVLSVLPVKSINTHFRKFSLRYQATYPGKMLTIGNTVLVAPQNQTNNICNSYTNGPYISDANQFNNDYQLCQYYADTNVTFPTTRAQLNMNTTSVKKVKWAGLYWQSIVPDNYPITNMQIKLKHSQTTSYQTIDYTTLDYTTLDNVPGYLVYSAFSDVTSYFVDNNLTNGTVTVGDIPSVEGKIDNIGSYGAWTLVLIYQDDTEPLQNFSIYDGWQKVDANNNVVDINISGFYTPKNAPSIAAQVAIFAAEGDKLIAGDTLSVKPSKQANFTELIPNMNSAINTTPTFTRTPNPINNQGIDIRSFELGTTGKNIISPQESSMTLRFSSVRDHRYDPNIAQDTYFPSMIAFSAQLYTPSICYDYTASIGDLIPITATNNRDINTSLFGSLPLKIQFLIRSQEADFTYFDTKARIVFTGGDAGALSYNRLYSEMSPPRINTYFSIASGPNGGHDEIEVNATIGQIALGDKVINNISNNGGVLLPDQTTYAILGYDFNQTINSNYLSTHFDILFDAKIRFNPGDAPVNYSFDTSANSNSANYIPRCSTNPAYNPVLSGFNVERVATQNEPLASRYTLWTQVTGRPYNIDIVAYTGGLNDATLTTPLDFRGTVELELINADAFQNNSNAGYDTTCENPQSIGEGTLIAFNPGGEPNTGRHTVTPTRLPSYDASRAVRNAAFRLWILAVNDINASKRVIVHQCTDKTNSNDCFGNLYRTKIDTNATGYCVNECSVKNSNCYNCLKTYYATPVCSRDNFSIRPDSYSIAIIDNQEGQSNTPKTLKVNTDTTPVRLSAGYWYNLDINTTTYNSNTIAKGYFNNQYVAQDNIVAVPPTFASGSVAVKEFNSSNPAACNDKNSSTIMLGFSDGRLNSTAYYTNFSNVGTYAFWISDSNWTLVDHADYAYKPRFDPSAAPTQDCVANSDTTIGKAGCAFYSEKGSHTRIYAVVQPYRFSMSDITVARQPDDSKNYTYFNDFSHPYYNDLLIHPINNASVTFTGLLVAKGKHIDRLSNFTKSCAANDVILRADIQTNPSDVNAITPLQQYLQYTDLYGAVADKALGYDQNLTLPKDAFPDTLTNGTIKPGTAKIFLHTTFKKPKTSPSNPIIASYNAIYSSSPDAWSNTELQNNYVPEGNNTGYDRNITYYFAKVAPLEPLYDNVIPSSKITPLSIDLYCSLLDCNSTFNLMLSAVNGANNWYSDTFYDKTKDGTTNLTISTIFGTPAAPTVVPNSNVAFIHPNATRTDINVSVSGSSRPTTVDIQIEAVPWLTFNPLDPIYGYAHYRVKFIGNSSWVGVGNTGHVGQTTSNRDTINRMNW